MAIEDELRPEDTLSNSAYGLRFAYSGSEWIASPFILLKLLILLLKLNPGFALNFDPLRLTGLCLKLICFCQLFSRFDYCLSA